MDSGATTIDILLNNGGIDELRIEDDGCGIMKEDFPLLCERFATSKLTHFSDLQSIATYGFRGEALASIAAVSKTTLTTKDQNSDDPLGTRVIYKHGAHTSTEAVACTIGTTIEVADLFATLPVRKTFLKQDETEFPEGEYTIEVIIRKSPAYQTKFHVEEKP